MFVKLSITDVLTIFSAEVLVILLISVEILLFFYLCQVNLLLRPAWHAFRNLTDLIIKLEGDGESFNYDIQSFELQPEMRRMNHAITDTKTLKCRITNFFRTLTILQKSIIEILITRIIYQRPRLRYSYRDTDYHLLQHLCIFSGPSGHKQNSEHEKCFRCSTKREVSSKYLTKREKANFIRIQQ